MKIYDLSLKLADQLTNVHEDYELDQEEREKIEASYKYLYETIENLKKIDPNLPRRHEETELRRTSTTTKTQFDSEEEKEKKKSDQEEEVKEIKKISKFLFKRDLDFEQIRHYNSESDMNIEKSDMETVL